MRGLARALTLVLAVAALAPIPVSGAPADPPTSAPFTPSALPCETFPCYTLTFEPSGGGSGSKLAPAKVSFFFSRQVTANQLETIRRDVLVDAAGVARTTFGFPISGEWFVRSQANPTPYNANSLMTSLERYRVD